MYTDRLDPMSAVGWSCGIFMSLALAVVILTFYSLTLSLLYFYFLLYQRQVEPMPLINGKRRRFVDDSVLPPVQAQQTYLDKIQAQRRKQEADALLEAIALGEHPFPIPFPSPNTMYYHIACLLQYPLSHSI